MCLILNASMHPHRLHASTHNLHKSCISLKIITYKWVIMSHVNLIVYIYKAERKSN